MLVVVAMLVTQNSCSNLMDIISWSHQFYAASDLWSKLGCLVLEIIRESNVGLGEEASVGLCMLLFVCSCLYVSFDVFCICSHELSSVVLLACPCFLGLSDLFFSMTLF